MQAELFGARQVGSYRNKREAAIWIDVKGKEGGAKWERPIFLSTYAVNTVQTWVNLPVKS